jgi:hypothetical protein
MALLRRTALLGTAGVLAAPFIRTRPAMAAEKIGRDSGGRLLVQVYPNNQFGGDTQMLAQLRSGALELFMTGDNIIANIVPVALIADLPFAFPGYTELWKALDGELGQFIRGEISKVGIHVFDRGWDAGPAIEADEATAGLEAGHAQALGDMVGVVPIVELFFQLARRLHQHQQKPFVRHGMTPPCLISVDTVAAHTTRQSWQIQAIWLILSEFLLVFRLVPLDSTDLHDNAHPLKVDTKRSLGFCMTSPHTAMRTALIGVSHWHLPLYLEPAVVQRVAA